jgi:tetratricopeptide (TPR) repeat protein
MIDATRVLRPLTEAAAAIEKLVDYQTTPELVSALQETAQAIDRTLRNLLRSDPGIPDELRLAAFSPTELQNDQLIPALRQRNLISLQLAGMVHELEQAARRAANGEVRAADADQAQRTVEAVRAEISKAADQPVLEAAHQAVESGLLESSARPVPAPDRKRRVYRNLALGALLLLLAIVAVFQVTRESDLQRGIAALQAERWDAAEAHLLKAAQDKGNATAQVYLARVYRRQHQYDRAAAVLREAAERHDQDDAVWRELGYLFLDLQQPQYAVERFRRAQELNPDATLNWIGLVRALRAAGDPSAEVVLQQAPAEVRAALAR